jgi:hypothetical protein
LQDWIEPFVARATRAAPLRSAATAAASPEAPLPITSKSKWPFCDTVADDSGFANPTD